jgi:hypothetical protein
MPYSGSDFQHRGKQSAPSVYSEEFNSDVLSNQPLTVMFDGAETGGHHGIVPNSQGDGYYPVRGPGVTSTIEQPEVTQYSRSMGDDGDSWQALTPTSSHRRPGHSSQRLWVGEPIQPISFGYDNGYNSHYPASSLAVPHSTFYQTNTPNVFQPISCFTGPAIDGVSPSIQPKSMNSVNSSAPSCQSKESESSITSGRYATCFHLSDFPSYTYFL